MLTFCRSHTMIPGTTIKGLDKMQTIAMTCLAVATVQSAILLGTLWYMAETGRRPAWLSKLLG